MTGEREAFAAWFKKRWPEFRHQTGSAFETWQEGAKWQREVQPVAEPIAFTAQAMIDGIREHRAGYAGRAIYLYAREKPEHDYRVPLYTAAQAVAPLNAPSDDLSDCSQAVLKAMVRFYRKRLEVVEALEPSNAPSDSNANSNALQDQDHLTERVGEEPAMAATPTPSAEQWYDTTEDDKATGEVSADPLGLNVIALVWHKSDARRIVDAFNRAQKPWPSAYERIA